MEKEKEKKTKLIYVGFCGVKDEAIKINEKYSSRRRYQKIKRL